VVVIAPPLRVADEGGGLERQHPEPHVQACVDDLCDLVEVARRDRHVVRQVKTHPVLSLQPLEVLHETSAVRVQLRLAAGPRDAVAAEHHRVEVPRESQELEPPPPVRADRQPLQVVIVEVTVGHAHRLASVAPHRLKRGRVALGPQQRHLAADQLGVLAGATHGPQIGHLRVYLGLSVSRVDPDRIGLTGVVARGAGQVAAREHAVRALAPGAAAAEQLRRRSHRLRQLLPAPPQHELGVGIHWPRLIESPSEPRDQPGMRGG